MTPISTQNQFIQSLYETPEAISSEEVLYNEEAVDLVKTKEFLDSNLLSPKEESIQNILNRTKRKEASEEIL